MNEISQINQFLTRIQKKWNRVRFILGAYLAITFLTGILLAVALFYYFQLTSTSYIAPTVLLLILIPIDVCVMKEYYVRGLLLLLYITIGGIAYIASIYALGFRYKKDLSI